MSEEQNKNLSENENQQDDITAITDVTDSVFVVMPEVTNNETTIDDNIQDIPLKPAIEINKTPKSSLKGLKPLGIKVFAIVLTATILLLGCFAGGYFLGSYKSSNSGAVALDERPSGKLLDTSEVYKVVNPSIVGIVVYNDNAESSMASGVVYSSDGYIITNDHIYLGITDPKFKIITVDGKEHTAKYIAGDSRSDLAVLKTNAVGLEPATFGNSNSCIIGEGVVAIGRPSGATNNSNISKGVISALDVRVTGTTTSYSEKFIQTDTAINPGSSGGALCNMYGQVIGITSSKLVGDAYEGVGYAIPSIKMKTIVESLIKNRVVSTRAKIGISYKELDSVTAELNNMPVGIYIASVDESSELYGKLKEKDIITAVNGTAITSSNVILDIVEKSNPGDILTYKVYRPSNKKTITITAALLADKGSSSYATSKNSNDKQNNDTSSKYNTSQFDFPEIK